MNSIHHPFPPALVSDVFTAYVRGESIVNINATVAYIQLLNKTSFRR